MYESVELEPWTPYKRKAVVRPNGTLVRPVYNKSSWVDMYVNQKMTLKEIAEKEVCCKATVRNFLNAEGVIIRPKTRRSLEPVTERKCSYCLSIRPIEDFYNDCSDRTGKSFHCKFCLGSSGQKNRLDLRETFRNEPEIVDRLHTSQKGCCAICKTKETPGKRLHIDHIHGTGVIRGLLCHKCNAGIGLLRDSAETIFIAYEYVKNNTS